MTNADYLADPFSAILSDLQPDWASYGQCEVGEPWALRFPESDAIRAHFVLDGEIWLTRDNGDVTHLPQGTAALLPFGAAHRLGDDKGSRAVTTDTLGVDVTSGFYRLRIGGPGTARIVCCTLHFNDPVAASLLLALPELITIDTADPEDTTFRRLFAMIDAETQDRRIGAAMLITRLVDIAIMRVLRNWLERADKPTAGLKLAVRDKHIGAALASIHRSPTILCLSTSLPRPPAYRGRSSPNASRQRWGSAPAVMFRNGGSRSRMRYCSLRTCRSKPSPNGSAMSRNRPSAAHSSGRQVCLRARFARRWMHLRYE